MVIYDKRFSKLDTVQINRRVPPALHAEGHTEQGIPVRPQGTGVDGMTGQGQGLRGAVRPHGQKPLLASRVGVEAVTHRYVAVGSLGVP